MATRTIPAVVEFICDRCGATFDNRKRRLSGVLRLARNGLDYQGNAVGPAGCMYELCDDCTMIAEQCIESFVKAVQSEQKDKP